MAFAYAISTTGDWSRNARFHLLKLNLADKFLRGCKLRFHKVVFRFEFNHLFKVGDCLWVLEYLQIACSASESAFSIR